MDVPLDPTTDVARLRGCVNDLLSIMAMAALPSGGEPAQVLTTVLDALVGMLRLAFVFARLNDPEGGLPIEIVRLAESWAGTSTARDTIAACLSGTALDWPPRRRVSIGGVDVSVALARL